MPHLSADVKHSILLEYVPHSPTHDFAVLACRHAVKGGADVILHWHDRWNGTPASLQRGAGSGKARILSRAEVSQHVRAPLLAANRAHRAVRYTMLLPSVKAKTGKMVSIQTLRRIGKEVLGARQKRSKKRTADEMSPVLCDDIASMRRKLQRISKERVLFLDETAARLSEAPTSSIVLPGEQQYVLATDTTSYAKRFDMIACCNGKQVFAPCIYTPKERSDAGVKGINTEMLVDFILNALGQETWALDKPPLTLVVDRARIHNEEREMEAFRERGGHVTQLLKMPPMAAKRLSPPDNALFHDWKEAVRKHGPLTLRNMEQIMADEWNNLSPGLVAAHYKHCGLTGYSNVYNDCPDPASHQHGS